MPANAIRFGLAAALVWSAAALADSNPNPGGEALHRLGSDPLQLRFEGETSERTWPIYVTATEAGTRARVHIGFINAISVMPEASTLSISVNDVPVAQTPIASATDPGALDVELPSGLLTQGYNSVRIAVAQRHRVDCSMEATYELWTQLDPASSGLAFPGVADPHIDVLDDLAAISPDASGSVTIRVVLPDGADATAVDNAMRAAEAVAIRAEAQRPRVEVVDHVPESRGLYVLAGARADLATHGFAPFLGAGPGRSPAVEGQDVPGRIVVVATGDNQKEIEEAIDGVLPVRPAEERTDNPSAGRALANQVGYVIRDALRVPLSDLGVRTEEFSGRLYRAAFDIRLPGDFYAADYDKLTLSLTAGYAAGLAPTSQILVRVNDREAGSMPMKNPRGDLFRDRPVSVSLGALRPGVNHVVVEAQTPDVGDSAVRGQAHHGHAQALRPVRPLRADRSRVRPYRPPAEPRRDLVERLSLSIRDRQFRLCAEPRSADAFGGRLLPRAHRRRGGTAGRRARHLRSPGRAERLGAVHRGLRRFSGRPHRRDGRRLSVDTEDLVAAERRRFSARRAGRVGAEPDAGFPRSLRPMGAGLARRPGKLFAAVHPSGHLRPLHQHPSRRFRAAAPARPADRSAGAFDHSSRAGAGAARLRHLDAGRRARAGRCLRAT